MALAKLYEWLTLPRLFVLASASGAALPWQLGVWDTAREVAAEPAHEVSATQPDRAEVQRVIDRARGELRACVVDRAGSVRVRWQLEPEGQISNVRMAPPIEDQPAGRCLHDVLARLPYPTFAAVGRRAPMHLGVVVAAGRRR